MKRVRILDMIALILCKDVGKIIVSCRFLHVNVVIQDSTFKISKKGYKMYETSDRATGYLYAVMLKQLK